MEANTVINLADYIKQPEPEPRKPIDTQAIRRQMTQGYWRMIAERGAK